MTIGICGPQRRLGKYDIPGCRPAPHNPGEIQGDGWCQQEAEKSLESQQEIRARPTQPATDSPPFEGLLVVNIHPSLDSASVYGVSVNMGISPAWPEVEFRVCWKT